MSLLRQTTKTVYVKQGSIRYWLLRGLNPNAKITYTPLPPKRKKRR